MMGKKFMIVKRTLCCGNAGSIGEVHEENGNKIALSACVYCKLITKEMLVLFGNNESIENSRIIWLPDLNEQDELNNIKELEKEI